MLAKLIALVIHDLAAPIVREYQRIDAPPPPCPYKHTEDQHCDIAGTTSACTERAQQWDHDRRAPATALGFGFQPRH